VAVHAAMTTQDEDATTTVSSWRYSAARAAGRRTRSEGRGVRRGRRCRRRTTRYHAANSDCSAAGRKGAWSVVQPRLCNLHWRRRRRRRRARPLIEVDGESTSFRYGVVSRRVQPRRLYILCWRELSRRRLVLPAVSPAVGHLTTPTVAGLPGLCENFRPTTSKSSPI